jgi:hypothetical protein
MGLELQPSLPHALWCTYLRAKSGGRHFHNAGPYLAATLFWRRWECTINYIPSHTSEGDFVGKGKELYCPCTILGLWKTCGVVVNSYCNKSTCGQITWTRDWWNHTNYILQWDKWTEMSSLLHALLDHLNNFFPTLQCHNQTISANDNQSICGFCFWTTRITLCIIKQDMLAIDVGITSSLFHVLF